MRATGRWLVALSAFVSCTYMTEAGVVSVQFDEPALDRWFYPFASEPGDEILASIFGATLEDGFSPDFDNRDGQLLVGFDTSAAVPPGKGAASYTVTAATFRLTNASNSTFGYDPTVDPYTSWLQPGDPGFASDPDPGRPVEVFGAAFRNGWRASTFLENGPYCAGCSCFPPNSCKGLRNVYPTDNCADRDISNNIDEAFDPLPYAVGTNTGLAPGALVPAGTVLTFELNVDDPCVQGHLAAALDEGMIDLVVASIFPAVQQQSGLFPKVYLKENVLVELGVVSAPQLDLTVVIGPAGDLDGDGSVGIADLLILLGDWGACPGCQADLDGDGAVGITDLLQLLANWG